VKPDNKTFTDQQIIEAIKKDDQSGYLAIYHSRTGQLKNHILGNGGSQADADEIEQKTIVILYEKIVNNTFVLNPGTKLSTFLYAIGRNLWLKRHASASKTTLLGDNHESINDVDYDLDEYRFEAQDREESLLIQAIAKLGEKCQTILKAKYYQKISDRDLSLQMGDMQESTIRKKRYKCIMQLKNHFDKLNNNL
jgi:RNA polymerase sigma factor (sigma-70 family)